MQLRDNTSLRYDSKMMLPGAVHMSSSGEFFIVDLQISSVKFTDRLFREGLIYWSIAKSKVKRKENKSPRVMKWLYKSMVFTWGVILYAITI